jgi:glycosyltransferase involved in cell wall biosynthesis
VEAIIGAHARLLRERGHDVRVVCGRGDGEVIPEMDSRHPDVEALYRALARGEDCGREFEILRGRLRDRLGETLPTSGVVIAHNVLTMPFNLALAAALHDLEEIRVVAWTHDIAWTNPRYEDFKQHREPYSLLGAPRSRTTYVAISKGRRDEIVATLGLQPGAVPIVPNGIDLDALVHVRAGTSDLLRRAGLDGPGPLLLTPFRVTRRKRIELAIEAVAVLRNVHPEVRLAVTGPLGPHSADNRAYSDELLALRARLGVEKEVLFLHQFGDPHPVDDEMMAELYRLAAAVLLPSESEGFGIPVLEAGANRVPVVCTDLEVFREAHGDDAWTFAEHATPKEIAAAVGSALSTRQARLQARVRRDYGWESIAERIEEVIAGAA